jgi:hypothetical protein
MKEQLKYAREMVQAGTFLLKGAIGVKLGKIGDKIRPVGDYVTILAHHPIAFALAYVEDRAIKKSNMDMFERRDFEIASKRQSMSS